MTRNSYRDHVAIQLQAVNLSPRVLKNGDTFYFNRVYLQSPYGIYYDMETGYIWIVERGYYYVAWNISVGGAEDIKEISFELKNVNSLRGIEISAPVILPSQVSGSSLLWVSQVNQSYQFINKSGGAIQLADTNLQANFILYQIN